MDSVKLKQIRQEIMKLMGEETQESFALENLRDALVHLECAQHNLEGGPVIYRVRPQVVVKVKP